MGDFTNIFLYCAYNYMYEIISIFLLAIVIPLLLKKAILILWDFYKELTTEGDTDGKKG